MPKPKYNAIQNHNPRSGHFHEVFGLDCKKSQELINQVKAFSVAAKASKKSQIFGIIANIAQNDSEYTFLISELSEIFALEAVQLSQKIAHEIDKKPSKPTLEVKDLDLSEDDKQEEKLPN